MAAARSSFPKGSPASPKDDLIASANPPADVAVEVRHNAAASRFEAEVDGRLCVANYHLVDGVMRINHTEVPARLEGRGIAGQIVRGALAYAEAQGLSVEPWCSYVRNYMRQHPESQKLLPEGFTLGR